MPRYFLEVLGGTAKVKDLVRLSPPNHGTTLFELLKLAAEIGGTAFSTPAASHAHNRPLNHRP